MKPSPYMHELNPTGTGCIDCCPASNWPNQEERRLIREANLRVREAIDRACLYQYQVDPARSHWTVMRNEHDNCLASCPACKWIKDDEQRILRLGLTAK